MNNSVSSNLIPNNIKDPDITIITVSKNSIRTISKTIESVLLAMRKNDNIEYIIQDNISNDNTFNLAKEMTKNKKNISLYSEIDLGIYDGMNKAVKKARGKYTLFLNSDDILLKAFSDNRFNSILRKNYDYISAPIIFFKRPSYKINRVWTIKNKSSSWIDSFLNSPYPPHPGFICKTKILKNLLFNTRFKIAADYHLIQSILKDTNLNGMNFNDPIVAMATGGQSNSIKGILNSTYEVKEINELVGFKEARFTRYIRNIFQYLRAFLKNKKIIFNSNYRGIIDSIEIK